MHESKCESNIHNHRCYLRQHGRLFLLLTPNLADIHVKYIFYLIAGEIEAVLPTLFVPVSCAGCLLTESRSLGRVVKQRVGRG